MKHSGHIVENKSVTVDPIDYRFLNIDTEEFVPSQEELEKQLWSNGGSYLLRAIPNWKYNQVLFAGGRKDFSESTATIISRRISGVTSKVAGTSSCDAEL